MLNLLKKIFLVDISILLIYIHIYLFSASGLQLFVAKDGSTALSGREIQKGSGSKKYEQVVIKHDR